MNKNPAPGKKHNTLSYADAGVNIDVGNALVEAIKPAVKSTARAGSNPDIGGFGGLFDLSATGFKDPVLVAANDGVGTKLRVAIEMGIHHTVGIDLVAMCVNDLIVQRAQPLFFLDYLATGALKLEEATRIIEGIAEGCRRSNCALIGGETAEMPGMYAKDDYDLAGFCVGGVERDKLLPNGEMKPGDIVLGLASSGVHSNGFSLVRKIMENNNLDWQSPAPFDRHKNLGMVFLEPTRIYVKSMLAAFEEFPEIRALAHITGGGLTENIPRILPQELAVNIDLNNLSTPPIFTWLQKMGGINQNEMLRTFNCGIGMVVIVDSAKTDALTQFLISSDETIVRLGSVIKREDAQVNFGNALSQQ